MLIGRPSSRSSVGRQSLGLLAFFPPFIFIFYDILSVFHLLPCGSFVIGQMDRSGVFFNFTPVTAGSLPTFRPLVEWLCDTPVVCGYINSGDLNQMGYGGASMYGTYAWDGAFVTVLVVI